MPRLKRTPALPLFRSAFRSWEDEYNPNRGVRPVVFDILAPDQETSILPSDLKMVLHVNPKTMSFSYTKVIERINTKGGFVEQHWGEGIRSIDFDIATGGFMRLYSGLSNITGGQGAYETQGTRRETIAYDKYLDLLALFHNNGSVYDVMGKVVFQGIIKITFDGGIYLGWFNSFTVAEAVDSPYQFALTANFLVDSEVQRFRSLPYNRLTAQNLNSGPPQPQTSQTPTLPPGSISGVEGALDPALVSLSPDGSG